MNRFPVLALGLVIGLPALAAPAGRIEGRVWNGTAPAAKVTVVVEGYAAGNRYRADVQTDGEGRFVARDVPPGRYRVSRLAHFVQATEQGTSETATGTHGVRVEVADGAAATVAIGGSGRSVVGRLVPGAKLAGRRLAFTAGDFRFLTLKEPRADGFPGRVLVLAIQEDGTFCCGDVPAGEYELLVTVRDAAGPLDGPDLGRVSRAVTVPADAEKTGKPHDLGRIEVEAVSPP